MDITTKQHVQCTTTDLVTVGTKFYKNKYIKILFFDLKKKIFILVHYYQDNLLKKMYGFRNI